MTSITFDAQTMPNRIQDYLIELISDGTLRPGQPLRTRWLHEEFGFTQTPLREALRALASQRLVEYQPHCGYRVATVTDAECLALFEAREALEGMAARKAAECATEEQLHEIMNLAIQCDQMVELDPDAVHRAPLDIRFHRLVVEASGNSVLPGLVLASLVIARSISTYGASSQPVPVFRGFLEVTHEAVAAAIASSGPDRAEAVMRAHIQEVARRTRARLGVDDAGTPTAGSST